MISMTQIGTPRFFNQLHIPLSKILPDPVMSLWYLASALIPMQPEEAGDECAWEDFPESGLKLRF